jgi:hypothetical protein
MKTIAPLLAIAITFCTAPTLQAQTTQPYTAPTTQPVSVTINQQAAPGYQGNYPIWTQPNEPNLDPYALVAGMSCAMVIWGLCFPVRWIFTATMEAMK